MWGTTLVRSKLRSERKRELTSWSADVAGVAWSADERLLASVGLDSTALVWSGENFRESRS